MKCFLFFLFFCCSRIAVQFFNALGLDAFWSQLPWHPLNYTFARITLGKRASAVIINFRFTINAVCNYHKVQRANTIIIIATSRGHCGVVASLICIMLDIILNNKVTATEKERERKYLDEIDSIGGGVRGEDFFLVSIFLGNVTMWRKHMRIGFGGSTPRDCFISSMEIRF